MIKQELNQLIADGKARIGVIGLGYVGLPLIVEFCLKGFDAIGFEVDEVKTSEINAGRSYIVDVTSENVERCVTGGKLAATTDFTRLAECDVIVICVPTPLRKTKDPDMSYILTAGGEIQKYMRRGQLIILESTTYPGTTDEVLRPMFEEKGFKLDEDFLLAFSPERVDPGNPQFQTHNIPKVVGGVSDDSTETAALLYSQIVNEVHRVSSARVAEAAKLWENTFPGNKYWHGKRDGETLQRPRDRYLGGRSRGRNQAFRIHAILSRAGHWRTLHTTGSALLVVEGQAARL